MKQYDVINKYNISTIFIEIVVDALFRTSLIYFLLDSTEPNSLFNVSYLHGGI